MNYVPGVQKEIAILCLIILTEQYRFSVDIKFYSGMRNAAVFFCFCKISSSVQVQSTTKKLLYQLGLVEIINNDVLKYRLCFRFTRQARSYYTSWTIWLRSPTMMF